ncbi:MAG TPA: DNA-formamidopyrimidine glycosylase family protein [Pyrinomonadaceae bacterium]|nr:DNA-formamidopyrimidine glycosylase family protein [Pyrinomonadaceae bacterium]
MPELPDITVYIEALKTRVLDKRLQKLTVGSPFLLRTAQPPISFLDGKKVRELRRLGKRICLNFDDETWLVLHLMIAGRLHWKDGAAASKPIRNPKHQLAAFIFENGVLTLTEAGTQRRASIHIIEGDANLENFDRGGIEVLETDLETFARSLQLENHTLKRTLNDPRLFSGIGNAYSDEILWHARLSPVALSQKLTTEETKRLFEATQSTLRLWMETLREEVRGSRTGFPEKVTAFRPEMAVHGKYHEPCPRCGAKIQRIRYASNETNYCPNCQTGGKLLADRALSRLLRSDWPRTPDGLEDLTSR